MVNLYHDLPLWNKDLTEVNAVIEIPKNSMVKYEFDKELNCVKVDRVGKTPIAYNFNYGFLPQSYNEDDKDPLDVIVLSRFSFVPWCVVPARVIWWLKMIDSWEFDYKILAVADDKYYSHVNDITDVNEKELEDIYYFMQHYKDLHNKTVIVEWWDNKENAIKVLKDCQNQYKLKYKKS